MPERKPYNPLDYTNLTKNVVQELMRRKPVPLPSVERFRGPGVYALFYAGPFEPYAPVCSPDAAIPIYVGKAVPPGSRKGGVSLNTSKPVLYHRLGEHLRSIEGAENLDPEDFLCRYLTVVPLWITMSERFLVRYHQPIWNTCIDGFGLHDPGSGRYRGEISWWDSMHPGRPWASRLRQTRTLADAAARLTDWLADHPGRGQETE